MKPRKEPRGKRMYSLKSCIEKGTAECWQMVTYLSASLYFYSLLYYVTYIHSYILS